MKPDNSTSLGTLFNIYNGEQYPGPYNHMQTDAVSLYILVLCQMVVSGLSVIYTKDEATFIQNMLFAIERTYRTIDFGVWESGSRHEKGRELNASSIGMAKAALEAANGLNIMGIHADPFCVLYSDPDAHSRNASVLKNLLPRESFSKNTDSALLFIIGFPAFAVDCDKKRILTLEIIEKKLKRQYGFKRYQYDSLGVPEMKNKINNYDGIESEWPIFFIYQAILAIYRANENKLEEYKKLIKKSLIKNSQGYKILPMYYHISSEGNTNKENDRQYYPKDDQIFLWGQSLYIIYSLLKHNLIKPSTIDPLQRHLLKKDSFKPLVTLRRYSVFRTRIRRSIVQVCLISINPQLQTTLSTYGVVTQNLTEIEPAFVCDQSEIISLFSLIGNNPRLGLTGRPMRPIGSINSCKIYHYLGKIIITYPLTLDDKNFYLSSDADMIISQLKSKLIQISRSWNMYGRPTCFLLLKPEHFEENKFIKMMRFLYDIKCNAMEGVEIKVDKFQNLIGTACNEYLDFLPQNYDISKHFSSVKDDENHPRLKRIDSETLNLSRKKSPIVKRQKSFENGDDFKELMREIISYTDDQCCEALKIETDYRKKLHILNKLYSLHDENEKIKENDQENTIKMAITNCFEAAKMFDDWSYIRFGGGLLGKVIDCLAPSISEILVKERILVIGSSGKKQFVITDPLTPNDAYRKIYEYTVDEDPRDICLQQELIVYISNLLISHPEFFQDIYKINIGWIIVAMQSILAWGIPKTNYTNNQITSIYELSPSNINSLLYITLSRAEAKFMNLTLNILNYYQQRLIDGSLCVVPQNFYHSFWNILSRSEGVIIENECIPRLPTVNNMMPDEMNFMIYVEVVISSIQEPVKRKLFMEMIGVIAKLVERIPEINFVGKLDIGKLIDESRTLYQKSETEINKITISHSSPAKDNSLQYCRFEDLPPSIKAGTTFYMTKTTFDLLFSECNAKCTSYPECNIS